MGEKIVEMAEWQPKTKRAIVADTFVAHFFSSCWPASAAKTIVFCFVMLWILLLFCLFSYLKVFQNKNKKVFFKLSFASANVCGVDIMSASNYHHHCCVFNKTNALRMQMHFICKRGNHFDPATQTQKALRDRRKHKSSGLCSKFVCKKINDNAIQKCDFQTVINCVFNRMKSIYLSTLAPTSGLHYNGHFLVFWRYTHFPLGHPFIVAAVHAHSLFSVHLSLFLWHMFPITMLLRLLSLLFFFITLTLPTSIYGNVTVAAAAVVVCPCKYKHQ